MTPDRQFSDQRLADLYDLGNAGSEDRDYYLSLAGDDPIDILDLGCGTGLLCLAYAAAGHRVTGVDPARAMLNVAKRAPLADRVTWVESSSETFSSSQKFDLIIMTGHGFQVLLSDDQVTSTLRTMAAHLKPEGQIVFESRNPDIDWDAIWARAYTMETPSGTVQAKRSKTDVSQAPDQLSFAWDYQFEDQTITSQSTLRFMPMAQITEFATKAGLELQSLHGDWDGSPFELGTSREMIFKFRHGDADENGSLKGYEMYSHMMVGADDLDKAKAFYDATFKALGGREGIVDPKGRLVYMHNGGIFLVTKPIDGEPCSGGNGMTIGLAMENPEQADAWHAAGEAAGGKPIEDPPGWREGGGQRMYLAYLRDPAGNKLCALHRG